MRYLNLLAGAGALAMISVVGATPAMAAGDAVAGLQAMKELNLIVLGNMNVGGGETEGKVFVGGSLTGNNSSIGFGSSANPGQGSSASGRATLTVGGDLSSAKVKNGNIFNGGATVGGPNYSAVIGGSVSGNIDLENGVTWRIGGNAGTIQGGQNTNIFVNGNVSNLGFGGGSKAQIGGNVSGGNLNNGQTVSVVGNISNMNLGNNNLIKVGGSASNINGGGGTTLYAGGSISGNQNGASFNPNYAYNATVTAPVAPDAPNVAAETAQLTLDLKALSTELYGLTANSSITWLNGQQTARFDAVANPQGIAVFNVDWSTFNPQQIQYNVPNTTMPIIINVTGNGNYALNANFINNAQLNNQQVIWNFGNATQLNFQAQFQGSVLATEAVANINTFEGTLVVKTFNQRAEVHLGTYQGGTGFIGNAVPEPATWAMMIAGFGLAGAAMRRRSRALIIA